MAPTDLLRITESDANGESMSQRVDTFTNFFFFTPQIKAQEIIERVLPLRFGQSVTFETADQIIVVTRIRPEVTA